MKIRRALAIVALLVASVPVLAQRPEFEVASVKPHTSDDRREFMVAQPGGRFIAGNLRLRLLIRTAFQLQNDQIVGGPPWLDTDRFDIEARASTDLAVGNPQMLELLKSLLADRFKLTTHKERRELPVFALERGRRDGTLGPSLRPTACPDLETDLRQVRPCVSVQSGFGTLTLRGAPFPQFPPYLASYVNRVIVDRTGLDGRYDIDLKWTPERPAQPAAGGAAPAGADRDAISIFTAVQEQLGLRLESTRDVVDVLVIDTLEHPGPD